MVDTFPYRKQGTSTHWPFGMYAGDGANELWFTADPEMQIRRLSSLMRGSAILFHATVHTEFHGVKLSADAHTRAIDLVRDFEQRKAEP